MRRFLVCCLLAFIGIFTSVQVNAQSSAFKMSPGERIAVVGNSTGERMNLFGHFETSLHLRHPSQNLVFRNFARPADEVGIQQRPNNYTAIDDPLEVFGPNLFLCFFGFNESFSGVASESIESFVQQYREFIAKHSERFKTADSAPRFVLVSPLAFESTGNELHPDGKAENKRLAEYTKAIRQLAKEDDHYFVDVFTASLAKFNEQPGAQFTINGIHVNEEGDKAMATWLANALFESQPQADGANYEKLRAAVNDKSWYHLQDYRMLNGWYVYGGRRTWDTETFPGEYEKIRKMVAVRDQYVWDIAGGKPVADQPDDSKTGDVFIPKTMFGTRDDGFRKFREPKELVFPTPEESIAQMKVPDGLEVKLFADEATFPALANPCQIEFDNKGRLWVSCMANYPQWRPDLDKPDDRLLIFEDTDHDGKADKCIPFYDKLSCPTGFEFYDGGVLVIDQPRILYLKDTDGDDRADLVIHLMDGVATGDTHHSMGAWEVSHDGLIYMLEGVAVSTTLETPYGPLRNNGPSGAYIWDPKTQRVRHFRTPGHGNPWCMLFDEWGSGIVGDGTGAAQHWASPLSGAPVSSRKTMRTIFDNEGMRPVIGSEFLRSRHLPDEVQDQFIYACVINMHGLTRFNVRDDKSTAGFTGERIKDLLDSTDMMFRPIDPHVGPDGAIWFGDWCNPLIGHMQYSQRDPNRDHDHGRIYRLVNTKKPLLTPETQHGKSIDELLKQLSAHELRTRCRARRELRDRDRDEVLAAVNSQLQSDTSSQMLCEAIWLQASFRQFDAETIKQALASDDFHVRSAAVNLIGNYYQLVPNARELLVSAVSDPHPRVRVEAVRGLSFFKDAKAAEQALAVVEHEMDYWTTYTLEQTLNALQPHIEPRIMDESFLSGSSPKIRQYFDNFMIEQMPGGVAIRPLALALNENASASDRKDAVQELAEISAGDINRGKVVYQRVCATCHIIGEMGKNFGPDLHDVGARLSKTQIIESIVHPNAEISEGYRTTTVANADGEVTNGFIVKETDKVLTLRVESGETKEFVIADLEERDERNSSSMPEGLAGTIAPIEFLDLVRFLRVQRKTEDGWFPTTIGADQPRKENGVREVSHDADIRLGKGFPNKYNLDADLFLSSQKGRAFDFTVHSADKPTLAHVLVRFKQPENVTHFSIENRTNKSYHDRGKSLAVWTSMDGSEWKLAWEADKGLPSWDIELPAPVTARFVKIGLRKEGILNLNHMTIYAK